MHLWLRAEASSSVGLGHAMRCLALGEQAASRDVSSTLIVEDPEAMRASAEQRSVQVAPAGQGWHDEVSPGDAVVFDGYGLTSVDWDIARRRGAVAVVCEDAGSLAAEVDIVVNPAPPSTPSYTLARGGEALLGPSFALVRREFLARRRMAARPAAPKLVVTLGGADTTGAGPTLAQIAVGLGVFDAVTLLQGPLAPPLATPPAGVRLVRAPSDVSAVFAEADAAVAAAGTTTWELLCMGVPTGLVVAADNQRLVAATAIEAGAALAVDDDVEGALGRLAAVSTRQDLSARALALVDGRGAERVLAAIVRRAGRS